MQTIGQTAWIDIVLIEKRTKRTKNRKFEKSITRIQTKPWMVVLESYFDKKFEKHCIPVDNASFDTVQAKIG